MDVPINLGIWIDGLWSTRLRDFLFECSVRLISCSSCVIFWTVITKTSESDHVLVSKRIEFTPKITNLYSKLVKIMEERKTGIDDLPEEIIVLIFKELQHEDIIGNCFKTSLRWQKIVIEHFMQPYLRKLSR